MTQEPVPRLVVYETVESLLAAGERAVYSGGDLQAGRRWFEAAYQEAERCGDGPALARAALGLGGVWVHEHRTAVGAGTVQARQRLALAAIDPRSSLALRLRARLAGEEDYRAGESASIMRILEETRQSGNPIAIVEALSVAHHCLLGPDHRELRLELAEEMIGQATRTGRRGDLLMGLLWRTVDLLLAGDRHAERSLAELRGHLELEDHLAAAFVVSAIEVMLSIRAGRFDEAEALAAVCAERGAAAGDIDTTGWYGGQIVAIRWFQGRLAELVPVMSEMVNSPMLSAVDNSVTSALAVAAATSGDRRLAMSMLARLRGRDLADLPRSSTWLSMMHGVVEAAALVGDADIAARAHTLLAPFARLPMIVSLGVVCLGSVQHALGVAALTTGDVGGAAAHLREAVHDNTMLGHWPAVVLSRARLAQALEAQHGPGSEHARRELELARREAAELGMVLPPETTLPAQRTVIVVGRRLGHRWQLELGERSVLVEHSVGMRHLASLIANPGSEIPATDLVAAAALADGSPSVDAFEERRSAVNDERARIAVGKAIRRAITRIGEADPVIGEELRATVETGARCCYRPR